MNNYEKLRSKVNEILHKKLIMQNLGKPLTILDVMAALRASDSECIMFSFDRDFRTNLTEVIDYDFEYLKPLSAQEKLCGELIKLFNNK